MNENSRRPITPKGDYKVGYGRPPQHTRFQPGRSGNPRGRPKRLAPTVPDILSQELFRPLSLREGEKITYMPAIQALIRKSIANACTGNGSAMRSLASIVETANRMQNRSPADAEQHSPEDLARAVAAIFAAAEAEAEVPQALE